MTLECCCSRLFMLQLQWQRLPRNVFSYKLHLSQELPSFAQRPILASFQPEIVYGIIGFKQHSSHRRSFVREFKHPNDFKTGKGREVIRGVQRVFEDKKIKLHETEQNLKRNSRRILADIKETRSKMREKMEEIVERENVWTIPNLLCLSRIAMSPYLGYLILGQDFNWALGVLTVAGVTDLLDGWIARSFKGQSSMLGSFLDPMADKILIATMFLTLTYTGIIPVPLTGLIVARDVALVTAGFVIRYKSLPPPRTLSRYFDVTHATAQLAPTAISKVNTMVQMCTVAFTLAAPVFNYLDHPALHALWYLTGATTIASAGSYLVSKNTFKFLKKSS